MSLTDRLKVFDKAWETTNKYFFDPKFNGVNWAQMKAKWRPVAEKLGTDKRRLTDAIQRMLNELKASHTDIKATGVAYVPFGTGVHYVSIDGKWLVEWVAPDSAAQRAGLERGWILTGATGDCNALDKPDTMVVVQLQDLQETPRRAELPCGVDPARPARTDDVQVLESGAIYVRVVFSASRVKALADQVARNQSAPAFVLDLRGNGGGGTKEQGQVFDLFLRDKTIIGTFRAQNGREYTLKTNGSKSAYQGRVIVLTDRNSQSAAETFAHAIQETGRGIVVGQRSRGVVLLGNHFKLPNQFDLHLAVGDYHTAKGIRLEGRGVIPDVAVDDLTVKDFRENRDIVLDRVHQLLQGRRP
jgi:carboxyl-terminal processing protease